MDDKQSAVSQGQVQPTPVSLPQKEKIIPEMGSVATAEFVKPSEPEPVLSQEVKSAGVENVSEMPRLTNEDAKAGIQLAKEAVPPATEPTGIVELPMTEQEAKKVIKLHKKLADSLYWLGVEVLRQFRIIHQKIFIQSKTV